MLILHTRFLYNCTVHIRLQWRRSLLYENPVGRPHQSGANLSDAGRDGPHRPVPPAQPRPVQGERTHADGVSALGLEQSAPDGRHHHISARTGGAGGGLRGGDRQLQSGATARPRSWCLNDSDLVAPPQGGPSHPADYAPWHDGCPLGPGDGLRSIWIRVRETGAVLFDDHVAKAELAAYANQSRWVRAQCGSAIVERYEYELSKIMQKKGRTCGRLVDLYISQ